MSESRKIHCPHFGFWDAIKRGKELAIRTIIVRIVIVIRRIVAQS